MATPTTNSDESPASMNDKALIEKVRLTYNLTDDAVKAIEHARKNSSVSAKDAMLQLGIISRRQLSDVLEKLDEDVSKAVFDTPVNTRLLQTIEQPLVPLFPTGIDSYELGNEIARGGMGKVIDATDVNLERPVAVKILLSEQSKSNAWQSRFIQEAQVTGQLQHPNIIPVYSLGNTQDGQLYFSMKKVEGITLHDVFKNLRAEDPATTARFTMSKLLQTFQMVCMAVAYAHSRAVIHRDIKPSNIMIGEFGEVFLMDWGLAKILEKNPEEGRRRVKSVRDETSRMTTRQGEAIGTPGYMSPELALGQLHLVGEQSDVYALGAILYEILTLRRPYAGKDIRTIVQRMLRTAVIPASQRTPGRNIPEHLEQITSRCLERDQTLRYRSVMDLYRELQGYIESNLGPKDAPRTSTKSTTDMLESYWQTRNDVEDVRRSVNEASEQITPWSRLESKREVWQQQRELERLERELDHLFTSVIHKAKRELSGAGDTRTLVNQIGSALKVELSETASPSRLIESERLIRDFQRWPNLELGRSRLAVRTDRPHVQIELAKCEEIDGIMTVRDWQSRGITPGMIDALTPGSYMLRIR
ncbi:MAG: serine/threonine protein kinase, partial [Bradymonadia bacterium]